MARRRSKAKARSPRPAVGGILPWFTVLILAGGIGWVWWRSVEAPPPGTPKLFSTDSRPTAGSRPDEHPLEIDLSEFDLTPPPALDPPTAISASPSNAASSTGSPPRNMVVTTDDPRIPGNPERLVLAQVALARRGISPGSVDGVLGSQTRAALRAFQEVEGLPMTGRLDDATAGRLSLEGSAYTTYTVTTQDLARLTPVPTTWFGKSTRERLDYETLLELVAEKSRAHPRLIRQINPGVDWNRTRPGAELVVPWFDPPVPGQKAAWVLIRLGEKTLRAYDPQSRLLVHFPCSIARHVEKRPVGELRVQRLALHPNYRFDPEIFYDSPEAQQLGRKLTLQPGPNNPVGTAWIGLDKPGYGIHGTPEPEAVGRTESRGCFRLANWNAEHLFQLSWVGMPVRVVP